jgi:hypothetical protein
MASPRRKVTRPRAVRAQFGNVRAGGRLKRFLSVAALVTPRATMIIATRRTAQVAFCSRGRATVGAGGASACRPVPAPKLLFVSACRLRMTLRQMQSGPPPPAKSKRGTLITLASSIVVGVVSLSLLFWNSSPGREFLSLPILGAACCVGIVCAIRLIRSGRRNLTEIGYVAIVVHTSLMLCTWGVINMINTAGIPR